MDAIEKSYERLGALLPHWLGELGVASSNCTVICDSAKSAATVIHTINQDPTFIFNHHVIWNLDEHALHALVAHEVGHLHFARQTPQKEYEKIYTLGVHAEHLASYGIRQSPQTIFTYMLGILIPLAIFTIISVLIPTGYPLFYLLALFGVLPLLSYAGLSIAIHTNENRHSRLLYHELHEMEYFCDLYAAKQTSPAATARMLNHIFALTAKSQNRVQRYFSARYHGITHPSFRSRVERVLAA